MVALMALYRVPIIEFFYSARYLEAVPAYTVFVFGAGFLTVFYVLSFALHGAGKVFIPLYTSLFGVLLLALLNWQWIPPYGLVGAAAAVTVVSFCMMIASLIAIKNIFKVSLLPKTFFLALFSTVFIAAIASIMPTSVYLFIPQSAVLFGLHLFFLFSQGVLRLEDLLPKKQKKGLS
jgi:O-antigen/teichoic acid export membrane protein